MKGSIIYIMGVSGCGKTTVGKEVANRSSLPFFDADDFHSEANREKMKAGLPLDDEDRKDWLIIINAFAKERAEEGGAVIACSALKEKYRIILSKGIEANLLWIYLYGSQSVISERMTGRKDHFMPSSLLQSQFDALEPPAYGISIDISAPVQTIVDSVMKHFGK